MKFNTTYIPTISLGNTVKELEHTKNNIRKYLKGRFNLTEVSLPIILEKSDPRNVDLFEVTRSVTFDVSNESKVAELLGSPSNWIRDLIRKLKLHPNHGIIGESKSVYRDMIESPTTTVVRDEIILQVKCASDDEPEEKVQLIALDIYKKFHDIATDISTRYKIPNIYPNKINFISAQELENENTNATYKEREIEHTLEEEAYFLSAPGVVLHSGHIHTKLPTEVYDLKNYYQLVMHDKINASVIKPLTVSILANGVQLADQLQTYDKAMLITDPFYDGLIKQTEKIIEIRINIPKLVMALLHKGHISEVMPGIISDESNIIEQRHKVEKM